jgi:hypothetical protein
MYLFLAVVLAVPLLVSVNLPVVISPAAQGAYDAIDNLPQDKLAIVDVNWSAGTEAENQPQTDAIMRHLFSKNKKFAILAFDIQGAKFAEDTANRIAKEYGKVYGKDWVNWGYRPYQVMPLIVQGMARDVPGTIQTDARGTKVSQIPVMKGVKTIRDIGLVTEITSAGTIGIWVSFIYGPYRTPIVYACTSVMAPDGFNMLDAGQIKGMLIGMRGGAEYEKLLNRPGFATRGTAALSSSHILIIVLIILGNIGYISSRRRSS